MTTVTPTTRPATATPPRLTTASRLAPLVAFLARRTFVPLGYSVLLVLAFLAVLYGIAVWQGWQVSNTPIGVPADEYDVTFTLRAGPGHVALGGLAWFVPMTAAWGVIAVVAGLPRLLPTLVGLGATRRAVGTATLLVVVGAFATVPALTAVAAALVYGARWPDTLAASAPALAVLLAVLLLILDLGLLGRRRGSALAFGLLCAGLLGLGVVALFVVFGLSGPWPLAGFIAALTCGFVALMARLPVE